jgi:hypothetical protein
MQQLIDWMEQNQYFIGNDFYAKQKELLETERDDHEHAFNESRKTHPMVGFKHENFDEYYKETYE